MWIRFGLWILSWWRVWNFSNFFCAPKESFGLDSESHSEKGGGKRGPGPEGAGLVSALPRTHSPGQHTQKQRLRGSWLRPARHVPDIGIASNYHHTSAFRCCCLCSNMPRCILKGALCSLKGKSLMFRPFFRTHSGKWALWMGTLQFSLWGQRKELENWWKLLVSSRRSVFGFVLGFALIVALSFLQQTWSW